MATRYMKRIMVVILLMLLVIGIGMGVLYAVGQQNRTYRGVFVEAGPYVSSL